MPKLDDGIELPDLVDIWDGRTGEVVEGRVVALDRKAAKEKIDLTWWREVGDLPAKSLTREHDKGWQWRELVGRNKHEAGSLAHGWAVEWDGRYEAAVLYQLLRRSQLDPTQATLYIHRLATAPSNRKHLCNPRRCRAAGRGLLHLAVVHSHRFGLGGRVTVDAYDDSDLINWYGSAGFRVAAAAPQGMTILELDPAAAASVLSLLGLS